VITLAHELPEDAAAVEGLLDEAFGPARRQKTCERLRERRKPLRGLSLIAAAGERLIGTVRLWPVLVGRTRALLLGPLAVNRRTRRDGIGAKLMRESLERARKEGHDAVILVGDEPYYRQFGFVPDLTRRMLLPGPVDRRRFLGLELTPGALAGAEGMVQAA
jgi:predicted N-acetyltransferase YhbS